MWRNLPSDEIEKYKLESDKVKAEAQQEWARKDTEREEVIELRVQFIWNCFIQFLLRLYMDSPNHALWTDEA